MLRAMSRLSRRTLLAAAPTLLAAVPAFAQETGAGAVPTPGPTPVPTIDMHSHAGALIGMRRVDEDAPFAPLAAPMRAGGMAVAVLAIVPDAPCYAATADPGGAAFVPPAPGDLAAYAPRAFARLRALARAQDMALIADAAALLAARPERPAAIAASEGGDFMEGALDRLDDAYARWTLRHLQLTHYRVNELGDVQTSAPVHGGLSAFGAEVIRRCNALGIVVDVAHGTYDLVRQAAAVSRAPLVLSHSSITAHPGPRQRRITAAHARVVAATGGVIGIWPPRAVFATMTALAEGIARAVDVVGIAHVGIGTDMGGLIAGSCYPDYAATPALVAALRRQGFAGPEIAAIMGGNYARVFARAVG